MFGGRPHPKRSLHTNVKSPYISNSAQRVIPQLSETLLSLFKHHFLCPIIDVIFVICWDSVSWRLIRAAILFGHCCILGLLFEVQTPATYGRLFPADMICWWKVGESPKHGAQWDSFAWNPIWSKSGFATQSGNDSGNDKTCHLFASSNPAPGQKSKNEWLHTLN